MWCCLLLTLWRHWHSAGRGYPLGWLLAVLAGQGNGRKRRALCCGVSWFPTQRRDSCLTCPSPSLRLQLRLEPTWRLLGREGAAAGVKGPASTPASLLLPGPGKYLAQKPQPRCGGSPGCWVGRACPSPCPSPCPYPNPCPSAGQPGRRGRSSAGLQGFRARDLARQSGL